jgi:hypothetical protein
MYYRNTIPKIMWVFWDNPEHIPKTVTMCIESWRKYHPDYNIILLTKMNYNEYINIPHRIVTHPHFNESMARFSDLIRLYALAEHGGIWLDSSILLKGPVDNWLLPGYEFSGFYLDGFTQKKEYPVIESWFLACHKGSEFVRLWKEEFTKIAEYESVDKYVESRKKMGVDLQKIDNPNYLAIHVSAQKVLQIDRYPVDRLQLQKAEDGPYRYLVDAKWDSEKAVQLACDNDNYYTPIMKMRGCERSVVEKKIDNELSVARCGWIDS